MKSQELAKEAEQIFGEKDTNYITSELVTLTPAQGGLGVPNLSVEAPQQYAASKLLNKQLVNSIKYQSAGMEPCEQSDDLKRIQQAIKTETAKSRMDSIDASLPPDILFLIMQSKDKGAFQTGRTKSITTCRNLHHFRLKSGANFCT